MSEIISHVSDTALWVATYRAMESERPDALFRDPFARRLAGEKGESIVRAMPNGRAVAWPMIVRTKVFDEIITRLILEEDVDAVLNLAAGLDTRAYRLALPSRLRWFDVDFPEMMAYRASGLADATPAWKGKLRDVIEIVAGSDGQTFRATYAAKFGDVVYMLHAFNKKSTKGKETPKRDTTTIESRLRAAKEHYEKGLKGK